MLLWQRPRERRTQRNPPPARLPLAARPVVSLWPLGGCSAYHFNDHRQPLHLECLELLPLPLKIFLNSFQFESDGKKSVKLATKKWRPLGKECGSRQCSRLDTSVKSCKPFQTDTSERHRRRYGRQVTRHLSLHLPLLTLHRTGDNFIGNFLLPLLRATVSLTASKQATGFFFWPLIDSR